MHQFASYVLRCYYKATGWNEDNLYANLIRSSNAILDFSVPRGLHLSVSQSSNALFRTSYCMNAMPSLNGSVGYIFTSCPLDVKTSGTVPFKAMIDHFKVYDQPRRPEGGGGMNLRDYLLYGRLYLPTGRLDALYSTRLSPTMQLLVAAISDPASNGFTDLQPRKADASNVMLSLQHDIGKWCTEYTWSAEDGMWGVKVLHNFGRGGEDGAEKNSGVSLATASESRGEVGIKRVDEEDPVEEGLRGRISAGAEFYFSAKEKSAGVSTGIRFTTIPDPTPLLLQIPPSTSSPLAMVSKTPPLQPPTTVTALFNPMMGHISGAYTAEVSRNLSLSTRFDFNVYSYDSEWAMGAEWWLRRNPVRAAVEIQKDDDVKVLAPSIPQDRSNDVLGVVKARASTSNVVALMWEGRLRNTLISLGFVSDFSSRSKPIKAIGLEVSYFSAG